MTDTQIICVPVKKLSPQQQRDCERLTLPQGLMRPRLHFHQDYPTKTPAYSLMLYKGKALLGWALIFPWTDYERDHNPNSRNVYFYVDKKYRRKGYGKILLKEARRRFRAYHLNVVPWNQTSQAFFANFDSDSKIVLKPLS
jgi:GNAT superfamily N-acetyltransferase